MGSKIEWTDETWNPTTGCSRVSSGCDNCYAMRTARRFDGLGRGYDGTTRNGSHGVDWTGVVNLHEDRLDQPIRWQKPRKVFVDSMSDLFHPAVPFSFVDKVFGVMALADQHIFQVLTKRPERMAEYTARGREPVIDALAWMQVHASMIGRGDYVKSLASTPWPLPNVWLGTSVENQEAADERVPALLQADAAVCFLSCEPLLGPVDVAHLLGDNYSSVFGGFEYGIDWVIVGGESGHGARPMHPAWVRSLRDQCDAADVAFFFKQWGKWIPYEHSAQPPFKESQHGDEIDGHWLPNVTDHEPVDGWYWPPQTEDFNHGDTVFRSVGKRAAGRLLDGRTHEEMPI